MDYPTSEAENDQLGTQLIDKSTLLRPTCERCLQIMNFSFVCDVSLFTMNFVEHESLLKVGMMIASG